jgi:hypothetical protein
MAPFPWTIVSGGFEDNQIAFKFGDAVGGSPVLQNAQWTASTGGDVSLAGGAVGELWQWVDVCPGVHYGFSIAFYANLAADCTVRLNISGSNNPDYPPYGFSDFVGSANNWYFLYSDVVYAHSNQILLGIQLFCSSAGVTSGGIGNIDTVELVPLKALPGGLGYILINGPYEEEGYDYYGNYD